MLKRPASTPSTLNGFAGSAATAASNSVGPATAYAAATGAFQMVQGRMVFVVGGMGAVPTQAAPTFFPQTPAPPAAMPPAASSPHLHYGGNYNPVRETLGHKPQEKVAFRSQKRFELMIQLENAGISDHAMSAILCISVNRIRTIKKTVEYLKARMKLTLGIVVDREASIKHIKEQRKEVLVALMPDALQVIANAVKRPATTFSEEKFRVSIAQDILDREGSLAKVSRAEIKPVTSFSYEDADASSEDVLAAIRGAARGGPKHDAEEVMQLSKDFSNSKTLSAIDQQLALDELDKEVLALIPSDSERLQ
jgi:hypothetical protein